MSSANNDGINGVDIQQIAVQKAIIVGFQSPNLFPNVRMNNRGAETTVLDIGKAGSTILDGAAPTAQPVDTSWFSHGGKLTLAAGNVMDVNVGGGGFNLCTNGPCNIKSEIGSVDSKRGYTVKTDLFYVIATDRMRAVGLRGDFQFNQTYFKGNVNFINNVHINGGLYVNGQLFTNHITSQAQLNYTIQDEEQGNILQANINPFQTFLPYSAAMSDADFKSTFGSVLQSTKLPIAVKVKVGNEISDIAKFFAELQTGNLRLELTFCEGLSLLSANQMKSSAAFGTFLNNFSDSVSTDCGDIMIPPHSHMYYTPAFTPLGDSDNVSEQAKAIMGQKPVRHKPNVVDGCQTLKQHFNKLKKKIENNVKQYAKKRIPKTLHSIFGLNEKK